MNGDRCLVLKTTWTRTFTSEAAMRCSPGMRSGHRSGHSAGPILIRRKNLVSSLHFFREGGFYRRAEGVPALRGSGRTWACVPGVDTPGWSNFALAGRIYVGSDLMAT